MDAEVREAVRSYDPTSAASIIRTLVMLGRAGVDYTTLEVPRPPPKVSILLAEPGCYKFDGYGQPIYACMGYTGWTLEAAILKAANGKPRPRRGAGHTWSMIEAAWGERAVEIEKVKPTPNALREYDVEDSSFKMLVASILKDGVFQSILVDEHLTVIDGGARLIAAKMAGLTEIPARLFCSRLRGQRGEEMFRVYNNVQSASVRSRRCAASHDYVMQGANDEDKVCVSCGHVASNRIEESR